MVAQQFYIKSSTAGLGRDEMARNWGHPVQIHLKRKKLVGGLPFWAWHANSCFLEIPLDEMLKCFPEKEPAFMQV